MNAEYVHPNLEQATLWWLHCTLCGVQSYAGAVPRFASPEQLWRTMLNRGWTRYDDGRVLCPGHSSVAECQRNGHRMSDWAPHPIEPDHIQWRFCLRCGAGFTQRVHPISR
jgi:hypothetical protein